MIGMIKKDLLMIKNNYKAFFVTMVIFVFYSVMFKMDMSFFLPLIGFMTCVSTLNYDEYNNWYTYATTLPQGKINVVKSKYLMTIGLILFLSILSIIFNFIIGFFKGTLVVSDSISTIMGELFVIIFMMSFLYPLLFKYGSEKGRIVMIIVGIGIFGIVFLFKEVFNTEISGSMIEFLDLYFPFIFAIISIFLLSISYYFSKKIYLHREF